MNRKEATQSIVEAKQQKNVSFEEIARAVRRHKVWTTSTLLGKATITKEESDRAVERLGLGADVAEALQANPTEGLARRNSARGSADLSLP